MLETVVLLLQGSVHFGLVLFMVLWQSPDTPVMSCFHVSALFCVGAWCSDPGTHVLSFGFMSGFGHSRSMFCLVVWACGLEFALLRALLSTCLGVARQAVRVFIGCMHSCHVLCCVARSSCTSLAACFHVVMSCVNTWLMSILISCGACSCPVLHMAVDLFCWPCACGFVLCEHMAFVLVFCVPCALMSIVLTPPILLPDYWLICPTCVFLVTVLICSLYNFLVFAVLCQFVIACILPCQACQLSCFSPTG